MSVCAPNSSPCINMHYSRCVYIYTCIIYFPLLQVKSVGVWRAVPTSKYFCEIDTCWSINRCTTNHVIYLTVFQNITADHKFRPTNHRLPVETERWYGHDGTRWQWEDLLYTLYTIRLNYSRWITLVYKKFCDKPESYKFSILINEIV